MFLLLSFTVFRVVTRIDTESRILGFRMISSGIILVPHFSVLESRLGSTSRIHIPNVSVRDSPGRDLVPEWIFVGDHEKGETRFLMNFQTASRSSDESEVIDTLSKQMDIH